MSSENSESGSQKPEGDLSDAEGVSSDAEGNPEAEMEVLQKGGKPKKERSSGEEDS